MVEMGVDTYAFEPTPGTFRVLLRHSGMLLHSFSLALGDVEVQADLIVNEADRKNRLTLVRAGSRGTVRVKVVTLDSLVEIPRIGLMKIDPEGYELPVLRGSVRRLREDRPRLLVEVHEPYGEQLRAITGFLKRLGYSSKVIHRRGYYRSPHLLAEAK